MKASGELPSSNRSGSAGLSSVESTNHHTAVAMATAATSAKTSDRCDFIVVTAPQLPPRFTLSGSQPQFGSADKETSRKTRPGSGIRKIGLPFGVVGGADHRTGRHLAEAEPAGGGGQFVELVRGPVLLYRQVIERRLQVLAKGDH